MRVIQRAAFLCGLTPQHAEAVQMVHYLPGQEYRPHFDWFSPRDARFEDKTRQMGNRLVISLTCLAPTPSLPPSPKRWLCRQDTPNGRQMSNRRVISLTCLLKPPHPSLPPSPNQTAPRLYARLIRLTVPPLTGVWPRAGLLLHLFIWMRHGRSHQLPASAAELRARGRVRARLVQFGPRRRA
jgi:hypothetical protein